MLNPLQKKRKSSTGKILIDEADLRRTILFDAFANGSLIVGSPLVYSRVHQEGFAGKSIPSRPFLGIEGKKLEGLLASDSVRNLLGLS